MAMTAKQRGRVMDEALSMIDGKICVCGDWEPEHLMMAHSTACRAEGCRCRSFRPVRFSREGHRLILENR